MRDFDKIEVTGQKAVITVGIVNIKRCSFPDTGTLRKPPPRKAHLPIFKFQFLEHSVGVIIG